MRAVKQVQDVEVAFGGDESQGSLPLGAASPETIPRVVMKLSFVIFEEDGGGFVLEWRSPKPDAPYSGDSWHESIEDAQAQASMTFGVEADSWESVEDEA